MAETPSAEKTKDASKLVEEAAAKAELARPAGKKEVEEPSLSISQVDVENERKRSAVRRWVTYIVIYTYCGLGTLLVLWLLWTGRVELALGVFGGIAGTAGAITGFWFGSRQPGQPKQTSES